MDNKIRERLKALAERLEGPLGNVPLDRVIRTDLGLFRGLRDSGATWPQIASALAAAGARRPDGRTIGTDHVRSAVTRQLKNAPPIEARLSSVAASPGEKPRRASRYELPPSRLAVANPDLGEKTKPQRTRADVPSKNGVGPAEARSNSGNRNQSILEKLARTRKLRES
jgi:hypothetical protein